MNKNLSVRKRIPSRKNKLVPGHAAEGKVTFKNGLGELRIFLYRKGSLIDSGKVSSSGIINFEGVQTDDIMLLNGTCAGDAAIEVSVRTFPGTPLNFKKEEINCLLRIV